MRCYGLALAWLLACIATLGSLYFSLGLGLEPCTLCWYQRICLYPLVITLGFAAWRADRMAALYLLPQIFLGLFISLYQVVIQQVPKWDPIGFCGSGPSCSDKHEVGLGFVTIPMLAVLGFFMIAWMIIRSYRKNRA